jgi:hypothetical protein
VFTGFFFNYRQKSHKNAYFSYPIGYPIGFWSQIG